MSTKTKRLISPVLVVCLMVFLMSGLFTTSVLAGDVYDDLLDKRASQLVSGCLSYNTSDTDVITKLERINSDCSGVWDKLLDNPTNKLFDGQSGITRDWMATYYSYDNLSQMARAYATYGSGFYQDNDLLVDIKFGLDWLYDNKYNESIAVNGEEWWYQELACPIAMFNTIAMIYQSLSTTEKNNYIAAYDHFNPDLGTAGGFDGHTITLKCLNTIIKGALGKNSTAIQSAVDQLEDVFAYTTYYDPVSQGQNFYTDGSFIKHDGIPYNGSYGAEEIDDMTCIIQLLDGSSWELSGSPFTNIYDIIYNAYEPLIYNGQMADMTRGRAIGREEEQAHGSGAYVASTVLRLAQYAPSADALRMRQMVKQWLTADNYYNFIAKAPYLEYVLLGKQLLNDTSITARGGITRTEVFNNMDRVIHQKPGYMFGISMFSSRVFAYQTLNNENPKGWYGSHGMTYLYKDGDPGQYDDGFWPTVNMYRLAGTTVPTGTMVPTQGSSKNYQNWVGGVEFDGAYATAGMSLASVSSYAFSAKKSWFMFDDEIVALGADIDADDGVQMETIVENRKLNESGNNAFIVNGTTKLPQMETSETMSNVNWAHLSNTGGYYFPTSPQIKASRQESSGKWSDIGMSDKTTEITRNYLTMWFDHGTKPENATYQYVLLPDYTSSQTQSYASNPEITVLENSEEAQAVKETSENVIGVNFWEDAEKTVDIITCDKKASVMMRDGSSEIKVSVSDPTHDNTGTITVEINRAASGTIEVDSGITVTQLSPTIIYTVDVNGSYGKSFNARFSVGTTQSSLGNDEFNSSTLDSQWNWIRQDSSKWSLTASSGNMRIITQQGDIWESLNTAKNILVTTNSVTGDWTLDCKLTGKPSQNYQQAGLVVYQDDSNYLKLVRLYADGNIFQYAKETGGVGSAGSATDSVNSSTIYLRIVKNGSNYSAYYSSNGTSFTQVWSAQSASLSNIKVGLIGFNSDEVVSGLNSDFDYIHLTTASTQIPGNDEFNDSSLNTAQWSWVRQDSTKWSLTASSGNMRITTQQGDIWDTLDNAKNILVTTNSVTGDWTLNCKLTGKPTLNYQQAGLVVYQDDSNYLKLVRLYADGNIFQYAKEVGGTGSAGSATDSITSSTVYLRIVKSGNNYSGYYSSNGSSFTQVWSTQSASLSNIKVGLIGCNSDEVVTGLNADFDYIHRN